jgi:hypothetical protein
MKQSRKRVAIGRKHAKLLGNTGFYHGRLIRGAVATVLIDLLSLLVPCDDARGLPFATRRSHEIA